MNSVLNLSSEKLEEILVISLEYLELVEDEIKEKLKKSNNSSYTKSFLETQLKYHHEKLKEYDHYLESIYISRGENNL